MDIIILGLGMVGADIMKELSSGGHNIVVIDRNGKKVEDAVNEFDVKGVIGNATSPDVLKEAGVGKADLMIAATSQDEFNILCCIIANKLGAKQTIARVSKPEYLELFKEEEDLGLNLMVNPQYEAAMEVSRMLRFPSAIKVSQFSEGMVELVEFLVPDDSPLCGLSLKQLGGEFKARVLICAANRGGKAIIPTGDFVINAGDRLFLTATSKNISLFFKQLGWNRQAKNVIVVGGSTTAFYLCQELENLGIKAKLIEKNKLKCASLSDKLKNTEIILGDGTDQNLLVEEGIEQADAFVALGNIDEQNIIMSMFASSEGVPKVITKIDQESYLGMLQKSGIYSTVSTKTSTAEQIIRFVRLIESNEKNAGNSVKRVFHIVDDKAEILEFEATSSFTHFNIPLRDLELRRHLLIAGIIRNDVLITPSGQDVILPDDNVIVVTLDEGLTSLKDILDI